MEKDFFVTCHGLSFSRRLLSKGFQAIQEKECIIYDIFVAGSGFFWAGKNTNGRALFFGEKKEKNFHQSVARLLHEHMLPKKVVGRFP